MPYSQVSRLPHTPREFGASHIWNLDTHMHRTNAAQVSVRKRETDRILKYHYAARALRFVLAKGIRIFLVREVSTTSAVKNCTQPRRRVMENRAKPILQLVKETATQWIEDQPFQLASSLAYYTIFSLAPLLIIVIAIVGMVFGRAAAEQQIVETIGGLIGQQSAEVVQGIDPKRQ